MVGMDPASTFPLFGAYLALPEVNLDAFVKYACHNLGRLPGEMPQTRVDVRYDERRAASVSSCAIVAGSEALDSFCGPVLAAPS